MPAPSNTTGTLPDVVRSVYNQSALFAYRANNVHRLWADLKWFNGNPQKGLTVVWTQIGALAVATTALTEATDPAPVAVTDTQPSVTLTEYGNVTQSTRKLRTASLIDLDMAIVRELTANMEESMDLVARAQLIAGTNVLRPRGVAKASLLATDILTAALVRQIRSKLSGFNAPKPARTGGTLYGAIIHPDISFDLMGETGQAAWSAPHVYGGDTGPLYSGQVQDFGGFAFIENANAKMDADAGSGGTVDVYHTLFIGEQALGEGVAEAQHIHAGLPVDQLGRFQPVGWYALEGFGRIRENSLYRIECASSIGANV